MSSPESIEYASEAAESFSAEVIPFPVQFEPATEENIDHLGHTIKMRTRDYGKTLANAELEAKRQDSRYMKEEWKPLAFINNESGILIKVKYSPTSSSSGLQWVRMEPFVLFPPDSLPGLRSVRLNDGQIGLAFKYYNLLQQLQGEESEPRIIIPSGFAYGVHAGHMGVPEMNIPPEPAGWYMVGEQVKVSDGQVASADGERAFPLSRIIDGPIGDPRDPGHRKAYGIY